MRLNVMGSSGFVMLTEGETTPFDAPPQPDYIYHVTALGDSQTGTCTTPSGSPAAATCTTLRAAILAANALFGEDLIVFDVNGAITLSVTGQDDSALAGDLDVTDALTIVGNGASNTVIQGGINAASGIDKVFSFNPLGGLPGFPVSISGLTIQFGRNTSTDFKIGNNEGGAFDFDASAEDGAGSLSIANCGILQSSTLNGDGGGIALFDGGTVTITNTTISGNHSNMQGPDAFFGGGIFVGNAGPFPASITISGSTLTNNGATSGGGAVYTFGPSVMLSDSRIAGNTSTQGASAVDGSSTAGASVTAANNWWGSNASPASLVAPGIVNYSPWLVMTFAAAPNSIYTQGTSILTAKIATGSDGSTGYQIADGTPVSIAGTPGSVSPASSTTASGAASSTYTAGTAAGTASASATVDSQTLTASITVALAPVPTLTAIAPASGLQGITVPVTLTGTNFVSGATVAVDNPGIAVSAVNVVSATQITATFTIAANAALGAANVTITTSGGTSAAAVFMVNPPAPTLSAIAPASGVQGATVPVTLTGTNFVSGATVAVNNPASQSAP
jgi:hypothetical protein